MKKRVLAGILMMVCVLASVMSVSAANSPIKAPTISETTGDNISNKVGKYVIRTGADAWLDDNNNNQPVAVKDDIVAFNEGTKKLDDVLANASTVKDALAGMTALTKIFDLHDENGGNLVDGKHRVVLVVPTLPDNCTDVEVLHYSMVDKKWELLEESTFDKANKTVTVVSDDLSPIAIYAKTSTPSGGQGTAHPTVGTSSTWMLYAAIALVALGAGVVVYQKKSR